MECTHAHLPVSMYRLEERQPIEIGSLLVLCGAQRSDSKFLSHRLACEKCTFKGKKKQSFYSYSRGINKRGLQFLSCVSYSLLWPQGQCKRQSSLPWLGVSEAPVSHGREVGRWISYICDAGACGELLTRSERTAQEAGLGYNTPGSALLVHFSQEDSASQRFYRVLKQHHHLETR